MSTCDIFSPGLSRLSILHIPNSYPSVTEYLHPMLENNISTTLTYLLLYLSILSVGLIILSTESMGLYSISWM